MSKKFKSKLISYWIKHYVKGGHCSLCGNTGVIDTTGTTTRAGISVGEKNYCICPNGLALRKSTKQLLCPKDTSEVKKEKEVMNLLKGDKVWVQAEVVEDHGMAGVRLRVGVFGHEAITSKSDCKPVEPENRQPKIDSSMRQLNWNEVVQDGDVLVTINDRYPGYKQPLTIYAVDSIGKRVDDAFSKGKKLGLTKLFYRRIEKGTK